MLTFSELGFNEELQKGIEELGFVKPTPIQEKVIPIVLKSDNDVVGLAQTGTGKTAAFGLPVLDQINVKQNVVQALILAPTRELCVQIASDLEKFSKYSKGLKVASVYGGASIQPQIKTLNKGAHIIAATPGRMLDLIRRKVAKLDNIKTVVLDEADEMLNMGFREDLDAILSAAPKQRRTLLFSATMPKEVARIANNFMVDPVEIKVGNKNEGAKNIKHVYYLVHAKDRYLALKRLADFNPNIYGIIFCRTRAETKDVADKLMRDGYNADALHGDLSQSQRDYVMQRFRSRSLQMLVATDVAARGIDVNDITHVINYNLPEAIETYTHRSGRTGRAEKSGICLSIVNHREKGQIPSIERIIGKKIEKQAVPGGIEICKKQLFNLIDKMENVDVDEDQISPFMEEVNKKLEWIPKEQLIKHFVSLEFNRFLNYYKDAKDLNSKDSPRAKGESKFSTDRDGRPRRKRGSGYDRFFFNVGKKDNMAPKNIIGLINDHAQDRDIHIGEIEIKDSFSFFEVETTHTNKILESFKGATYKGRKLRVEVAEPASKGNRGKSKGNKRRK
jgi:ATP-dependent RNA helicase DeaD